MHQCQGLCLTFDFGFRFKVAWIYILKWHLLLKYCANFNQEVKIYSNGLGLLSKMATMSKYGENPLKTFSRAEKQETLKPGIKRWELQDFKVYSNDDSLLVDDLSTYRSSWLFYGCKWGKYWKVNFFKNYWRLMDHTWHSTLLTKTLETYQCQGKWMTFDFPFKVGWVLSTQVNDL